MFSFPGKKVAKVNDARNDTCSRNVFEYDTIKDSVKLTRKTDHVICKYCMQDGYALYRVSLKFGHRQNAYFQLKKKQKNIYLIKIMINEIFNVIRTSCDAKFDCAV